MIKAGIMAGLDAAISAGAGTDLGAPLVLDAASGKATPLTQAEWDAIFAAAGIASKTVGHSHGFQDAAGASVTAAIGTALAITGTVDYRQAVAGWDRDAMRFQTGENARYALGVGPSPGAQSVLLYGLVDVTAPGAVQSFAAISNNAANMVAQVQANGLLRVQVNTVNSPAGAVDHGALGVFPMFLQFNRAATRAALYTERDKIVGTYAAGVADGTKGWGAGLTIDMLLDAWFAGAHAEWTEAEIKTVLQVMGFSPTWTAA